MTALLDNLVAVIVGAIMIGGLFVIQQRGQQSAVDATQRYQAQRHASELVSVIEREVENLRSRTATRRAFALRIDDAGRPSETYRMRLRQTTGSDGETYTSQFSFPTLDLAPSASAASPNVSGVMMVTYRVEATGSVAVIDGRQRPLYSITRSTYRRGDPAPVDQSVHGGVVDFDVTAFMPDGSQVTDEPVINPAPPRVHVTLVTAPARAAARASDQASTPLTSTRYARSIRAIGATAQGGTEPVDVSKRGGIPALAPADPLPTPFSGLSPAGLGPISGDGATSDPGVDPELEDIDCSIVICS